MAQQACSCLAQYWVKGHLCALLLPQRQRGAIRRERCAAGGSAAGSAVEPSYTLVIWARRPAAVNSAVDHSAARVLRAAAAADLRRNLEARRARRAGGGKRRHSADYGRPARRLAGIGRHSLDVRSRHPLQLLPVWLAAVHGSAL